MSVVLFVLAAPFVMLFLAWVLQGSAMAASGKYTKITIPLWPLAVATILVIIGVLL